MQVCFIINLDRSETDESFTSLKFILSPSQFHGRKIKDFYSSFVFLILLLRLIKETLVIHTKWKNTLFLSFTQIPVRTYEEQKPWRKGPVSSQQCDTETFCHLKKLWPKSNFNKKKQKRKNKIKPNATLIMWRVKPQNISTQHNWRDGVWKAKKHPP